MDKIKVVFLPCPGLDRVVNLKTKVRGDSLRLTRGEIRANYFRARVSIGKFTIIYKQVAYRDML